MTFVSYAQNFEDVLLWRALGHVGTGFYIDVGAHHPDTDSVTRAFYDRGWCGVNIEPVREDARRLQAGRPRDITLQVALGEAAGKADFFVVDGTGLSTLNPDAAEACARDGFAVRKTDIEVCTLETICERFAAPEIHFLKIDVEGAERAVLRGANLLRYRPWIILLEATAPRSTTDVHEGWEALLTDADYRFVWFDGLNRFYLSRERHDALAGAFQTPPNVFDDFMRASDSAWVGQLARAEAELSALQARLSTTDAALRRRDEEAARGAEQARHEIARLHERLAEQQATLRVEELRASEQALHETNLRLEASEDELARTHLRLQQAHEELEHTHLRLQAAEQDLHQAHLRLQATEQEVGQAHLQIGEAERRLALLHESTSWRLTEPLRQIARLRRLVLPRPGAPIGQTPRP